MVPEQKIEPLNENEVLWIKAQLENASKLHRPKGLQPPLGWKKLFHRDDNPGVPINPGVGLMGWKIIIAKQRSGPAGTHVKVRFNGPMGMWEER